MTADMEALSGLRTLASDCTALGIRRQVLLLRLPPSLCHPVRVAARRGLMDVMRPLAVSDRGQFFTLPGGHLAVVWRDPRDDGQAAANVMSLLREALAACPDGQEGTLLHLALPEDAARVQAFLGAIGPQLRPPPSPQGEKLDRAELLALEAALAHADLARFARRRPVWRATEDGLALAWEHRFLDLPDLAASLSPGRDLAAEPWLHARLSRTLERRLLALLADPQEVRGARPFAIDVSPASILDPVFPRFDRALPPALRGQVVLRLPAAELALMPEMAPRALAVARSAGYRTLLVAGTPLAGVLFPASRTGIELVELAWPLPVGGGALPDSVVLTGIDDQAALDQAVACGARHLAGAAADQAAYASSGAAGARTTGRASQDSSRTWHRPATTLIPPAWTPSGLNI